MKPRPGREPVFASLPLGVLTLSQARPLGDPPAPAKVATLQEELIHRLSLFHEETIGPHLDSPPVLVGTAGAVTTLAAMQLKLKDYDSKKVDNLRLTRSQVEALTGEMARLPEAARARLIGMEPGKAGVMVTGGLLVLAIMTVWSQDRLVVIDAGLLEGILAGLAAET